MLRQLSSGFSAPEVYCISGMRGAGRIREQRSGRNADQRQGLSEKHGSSHLCFYVCQPSPTSGLLYRNPALAAPDLWRTEGIRCVNDLTKTWC